MQSTALIPDAFCSYYNIFPQNSTSELKFRRLIFSYLLAESSLFPRNFGKYCENGGTQFWT